MTISAFTSQRRISERMLSSTDEKVTRDEAVSSCIQCTQCSVANCLYFYRQPVKTVPVKNGCDGSELRSSQRCLRPSPLWILSKLCGRRGGGAGLTELHYLWGIIAHFLPAFQKLRSLEWRRHARMWLADYSAAHCWSGTVGPDTAMDSPGTQAWQACRLASSDVGYYPQPQTEAGPGWGGERLSQEEVSSL